MGKSILQPAAIGGVVHTLAVDHLADKEVLRVQADGRASEIRVEVTAGETTNISFTDCAEFDGEQDAIAIAEGDTGGAVVSGRRVSFSNVTGWRLPSPVGTIYRFTIPACVEWSLWLTGTATVKVTGRLLD